MDKIPDTWLNDILGGLPPEYAAMILLALIGLAAWGMYLWSKRGGGPDSFASAVKRLQGDVTEAQVVEKVGSHDGDLGRMQERLDSQGKTIDSISEELRVQGKDISKIEGRMDK